MPNRRRDVWASSLYIGNQNYEAGSRRRPTKTGKVPFKTISQEVIQNSDTMVTQDQGLYCICAASMWLLLSFTLASKYIDNFFSFFSLKHESCVFVVAVVYHIHCL